MSWFKTPEEIAAQDKAERDAVEAQEKQEEHNRGQEECSKSTLIGRVVHDTVGFTVHSKEFNDGWDNAARAKR